MYTNFYPSIVVHGGADNIPTDAREKQITGVKKTAKMGFELLEKGYDAIDAVETSIIELENNPVFNAGTGSLLNIEGNIEMDALIVNGKLDAGAVAAIRYIKNPISVARKIMEETPHILLAGEGANKFAKKAGIKECETEELITEKEYLNWQEFMKRK